MANLKKMAQINNDEMILDPRGQIKALLGKTKAHFWLLFNINLGQKGGLVTV